MPYTHLLLLGSSLGAAIAGMAGLWGAQQDIVLRTGEAVIEVDPVNGAFRRMQDLASGLALEAPEGLAENFRLVLRRPDQSTVTILGKDQRLSTSQTDGSTLTLRWDGPLRDQAGEEHHIAVRMTVRAEGGALTFGLHLENGTTLKVQHASYPYVGGVGRFGAASGQPGDATLWAPTSNPTQRPLQPTAGGAAFGYPGHLNMSFVCVQSQSSGKTLYIGIHDAVARHKTFQLVEADAPGGTDLAACVQHTPFVPPGGSFDGAPVVFQVVNGDWMAAARLYRDWFGSTFGITRPEDDWIRRQSFFLMTMFMLPEGTINYTFRDIPRWARAARQHGLKAVQISGWQMGGHDNGYPLYEPDPRLGTWEELEKGIRACHRLGLKVFFFVNYQPMMVEMERYKAEWSRYREMTADGGYTWMAGWGMGTLWARAGHPKLMTWANLAFPQFRKIIVDYFVKLASIGADGVHVDKMFPTAVDYNPDSPLSPDTATWEGAILLTKEIMAECRRRNPEWCMSFECNWDRMLQFGGATWWVGNQLITRKVFPEHVETLAISQAYDYLGINNAVREGHAVMLAPLNFTRGLEWPPVRGLADYIKEVKRIRDRLEEAVFFGEALGQGAVAFGQALPDGVACNVFRNRHTSLRVCILTNSRMQDRTLTFLGFEGRPPGRVRVHTPHRAAVTLSPPAQVKVPAERVVFVEELGGGK